MLTPAGEAALEASRPSRVETRLLWVLCVCLGILSVIAIIGWVT